MPSAFWRPPHGSSSRTSGNDRHGMLPTNLVERRAIVFVHEVNMRDFQSPGRSTVHALNGMAATSHPLASLAAIDTLRAGGTAADAAVAAVALLGVIEPQSTGIGGDGFALYAPGGADRVIAYNGSGKAPMRASADWYLDRAMPAIPLTGPHSVTVPGAVDLWATLLSAHGRRGLDAALQPAIRAAAEGFSVAPRAAWDWARNVDKLRSGVNAKDHFLPDKAPWPRCLSSPLPSSRCSGRGPCRGLTGFRRVPLNVSSRGRPLARLWRWVGQNQVTPVSRSRRLNR